MILPSSKELMLGAELKISPAFGMLFANPGEKLLDSAEKEGDDKEDDISAVAAGPAVAPMEPIDEPVSTLISSPFLCIILHNYRIVNIYF